ncbi:MAG TPA: hypothetical protein VN519_10355 [Bryobacteraceae bacterium]|nr:hypothetical protein [Bryobacteraceae bacterium]
MKRLITAAFLAALAIVTLHAEDLQVIATIPFDFHACSRVMPSGKYVIQSEGSALLLRAEGPSRAACITVPHAAFDPTGAQTAKLVFRRYGRDYFLRTIWGGLSNSGKELPVERQEKIFLAQIKRNGLTPTVLALAAR